MDKKNQRFVHLHVHSDFSLLDGACRIPDLVSAAKNAGMDAIAITDHGTMYGVIPFYKEAVRQGVRPIIGCEVYVAPEARQKHEEINGIRYYHLILLAENQTGYKNLVKLVSFANLEGFYYKPRVDHELLRKYHEGLICLSACIVGEVPQAILSDDVERAKSLVHEYVEIFGKNNYFLELQNHGLPEEEKVNRVLKQVASEYGIGLVATNDVHYIRKEDAAAQDVLLCIQTGKHLDDRDRMRFRSDEYYLRNQEEMAELFQDVPEALENTWKIADRCHVEFEFGKLQLPFYPVPTPHTDAGAYLRHLCESHMEEKYGNPTAAVLERMDHELSVIHQMGYDSYFLIVWDFVRYAKEHGIGVGPGRGSAAGSVVAYLLGITNLDPLKYGLLFERFLNPERVTMPDIDVDFDDVQRGKVIEYVKEKYGKDHVAQIATFGTMAARGAVKDVGRVMDLPYGVVTNITKLIPDEPKMTLAKALEASTPFRKAYEENPETKHLIDMAMKLEGMPRHSSTHAAGVVIASRPLMETVPLFLSDGTLVTEYDKDAIEELGLLKMDFLGLRTLSIIADTVKNVKQSKNVDVDVNRIPLADEETSKLFCEGKTQGIFQMESKGMTALVKEIAPRNFADLIPTVALYRPGPLGSGMVENFIAGRRGEKKVEYMHPMLKPILEETYGVVLYQEQVMQIVRTLAGFSLGRADLLRRAMGKKKADILIGQKEAFLEGCRKNGVDEETANHIFDILTHFADYGFNKSHSAAYALVAWQTAYLKAHYPVEFMAATMSNITETDKLAGYIELGKREGIRILPPDVNASSASFIVDGDGIRLGLAAIRNVGERAAEDLVAERKENGTFRSFPDFCKRVKGTALSKRAVKSLIICGAFDSFRVTRNGLLTIFEDVWNKSKKNRRSTKKESNLFRDDDSEGIKVPNIPEADAKTLLAWEKQATGVYISGHPLDAYQPILDCLDSVAFSRERGNLGNKTARLGGIITKVKRIRTKKGDEMCFATIEDFTGQMDVVVFPNVYEQYGAGIAEDVPVVFEGRLEADGDETKLIVVKSWQMDEYRPRFYLRLPDGKQDQRKTEECLRTLLDAFHGTYEVFLQKGGIWKRLGAGIGLCMEAKGKLIELLGEKSVVIR